MVTIKDGKKEIDRCLTNSEQTKVRELGMTEQIDYSKILKPKHFDWGC